MMWQKTLRGDSLSWLVESDQPEVRYLALRDLLDRPAGDPALTEARQAAYGAGRIGAILAAMAEEGYWVKPGAGYGPKYRSSVWALILLAQLGASAACDERIGWACGYMLDHALAPAGQLGYNGTPGGTIDCLQGNLCWALVTLGCTDPRLESAYDWMARSQTGEGVAPAEDRRAPLRYYSYKCGPAFACGANNKLPCAWGAVKVLLAFAAWPGARRTPLIERAIRHGVEFLLSSDPVAGYPEASVGTPSGNWWQFGFPIFYIADVLQVVETLTALGYGNDPRLAHAWEYVLGKQDEQGRWPLEYHYGSKTWGNYGRKGQPSPWVTLRALRALRAANPQMSQINIDNA